MREVAIDLWEIFAEQRDQVLRLDRWYKNRLDVAELPAVPKTKNENHVYLRDRASTGWARLVVGTVAQALYLDGMHTTGVRDNSPLWQIWQVNALDRGQVSAHRSALAHGMAYNFMRPVVSPMTGKSFVKIRSVSAKRATAVYADDADQHPMYTLEAIRQPNGSWHVIINDDTTEWTFSIGVGDSPAQMEYVSDRPHGLTVPPCVRLACLSDLEGEVEGEIEPFIPVFGRIDQDTFDRLVVQRWGAHKVRFGSGIGKPKTDDEQRAASLQLREGELLIAEDPQARFGTLDATPLDGYIKARDADIRDLAAVTQTPPHHLLGQMANLSAEALAAAEASLMRKVDERKHFFGEGWEMTLRLAGLMSPEDAHRKAAMDFEAQVRWKDTESRSLNQVADALSKIAGGLGIPFEMLWERIPNWTAQDTEDAKVLIEEQRALALLEGEGADAVNGGSGGNDGGGNGSDRPAPGGAGAAR